MQADIETLRFVAGTISSRPRADELIEWAVQRMLNGDESPATVELAALDPISSRMEDAVPIFRRVLSQAGIRLDDQEALLKAYFHCLVQEIAVGKLDPLVGVERIRNEIIPTALYREPAPGFHRWYDERLREWDLLSGGLNPWGSAKIPPNELPNVIRHAALRAMKSNRGGQQGSHQ